MDRTANAMKLRKGQKVKVYQDFITCQKLEGTAKVLDYGTLIVDNCVICHVLFPGRDELPVVRTINLGNC